ncbi:MAG TPA: vWA domain-containing protein [Planctomycetota bacterium]|nr:vWA domain-containing protein [Planctomycetota bacterium]
MVLCLAACSGSSGGGGTPPGARIEPIKQFQLNDWNLMAEGGAAMPRADAGRLRLEASNTNGVRAKAAIASRIVGQFSDFSAKLVLARPNTAGDPADYEAFLRVGIQGTTQSTNSSEPNKVATEARIGLRATNSAVMLVTQLLDALGNPLSQQSRNFGSIDTEEGKGTLLDQPVPLRIEVDQRQQVVRFFSGDGLEFIYVPTALQLPPSSTVGIEANGNKFLVFAEDFLALDVDSTEPSFTLRRSAVGPITQAPGRVQFLFTLRDQNDNIIDLPASQLVGTNLFFRERGADIDRQEANPIFKRANLPQDVVIVLDYTESLSANGGIAPMVQGAKNLADGVWSANAMNRVQFWEFHDSFSPATNLLPQVMSPNNWLNSSKRNEAFERLDQFNPYHGFSRVFDAVFDASESFFEDPRQAVQSVAFLSDGFDTGGQITSDQLIGDAQNRRYSLYPIAIGAAEPQQRLLRRLAAETDGGVYDVPSVGALVSAFSELAGDLGSLYSASYISSLPNNSFANIELDLSIVPPSAPANTAPKRLLTPVSTNLQVQTGDTRIGLLDFRQISFVGSSVVFRADARFVPRNVGSFTIGTFTGLPMGTTVTTRRVTNGVLRDWANFTRTVVSPTDFSDTATGPTLQFGDFGDFLELQIDGVDALTSMFSFQATIVNTGLTPVAFRTTGAGSTVGMENVNWQFSLTALRPPTAP